MKKILLALLAATALVACGKKDDYPTIPTVGGGSGDPSQAQAAPVPQQQHASGDNGMLWGLGGFLLGRATAPTPAAAPAFAPQAPTYQAPVAAPSQPSTARTSWFSRFKRDSKPAVPAPTPSVPVPSKPTTPLPTTSPKVAVPASTAAPAPTAAPKLSYSGPTGYGSVTQSKPSYSSSFSPSRSSSTSSFSSPSRSSSSSSFSSGRR